jgi:hypothetical protein
MTPVTLDHIAIDFAWADEVLGNAKALVAELLAGEISDRERPIAQLLQVDVRDVLLLLGRCGDRLGELRAEGGAK